MEITKAIEIVLAMAENSPEPSCILASAQQDEALKALRIHKDYALS